MEDGMKCLSNRDQISSNFDFTRIQLEGRIESACKHSRISSTCHIAGYTVG